MHRVPQEPVFGTEYLFRTVEAYFEHRVPQKTPSVQKKGVFMHRMPFPYRRSLFLVPSQAQSFLVNPVEERIYCDDLLSDELSPVCGINALAHYTWLNPDSERMIMVPVKQLREFKSSGVLVRPN